ncbi:ATP-binding cassette domain-containing protein [Chromobacterium phragmitis]|uniref:Hemin ABC transporter ATP-binding protein n=1 Tax=Chromobacterium phragmitis TaxID=2202141 RepID=A0A344UN33_9NEIS|nr:ATP-binding cassette domain-containing protein [Chromobacterium phragmitis]AXE36681.1 hemin ABC transporter ATP-binding protein [Chromobacterium phragmitis]
MLEARRLSLSKRGRRLLDNVSLTLSPGELLIVLGPNGAGKSTLLKLLSGLWRADAGDILLSGHPLAAMRGAELAGWRAVVEQHSVTPAGWRGEELVAAGAYLYPASPPSLVRNTVADALRLTEAEELASLRLTELSGGQRQRLQLARALCQLLLSPRPERYLLLDEPTAAQDFAMADTLMARTRELARRLNIGALAVVHDLNLALRHGDRVLLLNDGRSAGCGVVDDMMRLDRLETVYGIRLAELSHPEQSLRAFVPLSSTHSPKA